MAGPQPRELVFVKSVCVSMGIGIGCESQKETKRECVRERQRERMCEKRREKERLCEKEGERAATCERDSLWGC